MIRWSINHDFGDGGKNHDKLLEIMIRKQKKNTYGESKKD